MKFIRVSLVSLFTFTLVAAGGAQQNDDRQRAKELYSRMLSESIDKQIPPKRKFGHKIKIATDYDKFQDQTDVQLMHTEVFRRGYKLLMTALYSYPGKTPAPPESVTLVFNSTAPDWKYLHEGERRITILADHERYGPWLMQLLNTRIESTGNVTETIGIKIDTLRFLRIINADDVQMQVGDAEFTLEFKDLEALRDFASRMRS